MRGVPEKHAVRVERGRWVPSHHPGRPSSRVAASEIESSRSGAQLCERESRNWSGAGLRGRAGMTHGWLRYCLVRTPLGRLPTLVVGDSTRKDHS